MKNNKEREREREGTIGKNRKDSISWQRREEKSHRETFPPPFFSSLSFHSKEAGVALIPSVGWGEILDSCWCELWLRISSLARGFYEWITRGSPPLLHPPTTLWAPFSALSGFRRPIEKRMSNDWAVGQLLIERSIWNPVGQSGIEDFEAAFTLTIQRLQTDRSEIEKWMDLTMEWLLCSINLENW